MSFKKYFYILFIFITNIAFAQKASQYEIKTIANNFLSNSKQIELINETPKIETVHSTKTNDVLFYIYNYENAFIIISANKNHTPIKAFSFENNFNTKKTSSEINMLDILISDYENFNIFLSKNKVATLVNQKKWEKYISKKTNPQSKNDTIGPLLPCEYGQLKPKDVNGNNIIVTNYYTPNHYSVGCVAITLTNLLKYYEWPRIGQGSYSYTDNYGSTKGTHTVNFEEKYYNWSLILDKYKGVESSEAQRKELGRLAYHAATSINMDYEYNGSTSNINRIPNTVKSHFRYIADYKEKNASDFWQVLDQNLYNGIPAQFAIYTSTGAGHAVVGDGIKYIGEEKYYHLNMGWWGNSNGWYQIQQTFNAGGYTNITAAVLNMIPVPELDKKPKIDFENKTATLKWYYPERNPAQNFELQMKIGVADWETLTDTFTNSFSYVFQADDENNYSFRIKAKVHDTWYNDSWSNIITIKQNDFKPKGKDKLTIYPSFASNNIKVSYKKLAGSTIRIFNLNGQEQYHSNEEIILNEFNVNVSNFETGIYILQIINETENETIKFLKL